MAQRIEEVMTKDVRCVSEDTPVNEVAAMMRDHDIGDVLVTRGDNKLCGILTDRDIVVRVIAEGTDPASIRAGDICTDQLVTLAPDASVDEAVELMRKSAVRRVPVVRDEVPVGIVSIGDLAQSRDPKSALADISKAAPNN